MVTLVSLVNLWIALGVYVSTNGKHNVQLFLSPCNTYIISVNCTEFVEGGFNEDDGRYRKEDSTCGTPAPI